MEMIHDAVTLSDEEDGFAALQDDEFEEDAADEEFTASGVVNPSSQGVQIIRAGDDTPVVEDVTGTSEGSNLEALAQALDTLQSITGSETEEQSGSRNAIVPTAEAQNLVEVALMQANIIEMPAADGIAVQPKIEPGERLHECSVCNRRFKEVGIFFSCSLHTTLPRTRFKAK
jgi:hypothetical protein